MKRYDTYKDSGVQWLGEIPGHWECTSLGRVLCEKLQYGASESGDLEYTNDSMRYIRITDITLDGKLKKDCCKYLSSEIGKNYPVRKGDVLLARSGATVGKALIYNEDNEACYAGYLIKASIQQDKVIPTFFFYFTQTSQYDEWKNRIFIQATIQNISAEKYTRMKLCIPPLSEQRSIVSFLDAKCGKIDEWVTKKQKEVEHLQELKQRVIADAVTRGLNPHVKMKATNIPWLKEIPGHWGCVFINRLFNIKAGGDVKPELYADKKDENHPFPVYTNTKSADDVYAYTSLATCPSNSITVTGRGEVGHAFFRETPYDAIVRLLSLTPKSNIICKFYAYFIDTVIPFSSDSAAIGQLSAVQIKQKHVILPPLSEQKQIVSYLDAKCSKIDKLIANITKEIERIKEYKQRLISDVVTGQIKVC